MDVQKIKDDAFDEAVKELKDEYFGDSNMLKKIAKIKEGQEGAKNGKSS